MEEWKRRAEEHKCREEEMDRRLAEERKRREDEMLAFEETIERALEKSVRRLATRLENGVLRKIQKGVLSNMDKLRQGIREVLVETQEAAKQREEQKVKVVPLLLRIRKGNTASHVTTRETMRPETVDSDELYALRVANGLRPPPTQDSTDRYELPPSFNRMESREEDGMQGMKGENHVDSDETSFFRDIVVKCFELSQTTVEMRAHQTVLESTSEIDSL